MRRLSSAAAVFSVCVILSFSSSTQHIPYLQILQSSRFKSYLYWSFEAWLRKPEILLTRQNPENLSSTTGSWNYCGPSQLVSIYEFTYLDGVRASLQVYESASHSFHNRLLGNLDESNVDVIVIICQLQLRALFGATRRNDCQPWPHSAREFWFPINR